MTTNDFPTMNIDTKTLVDDVTRLLDRAHADKLDLGAVNWGDLGVVDVEYRLSMLDLDAQPSCVVMIEEASPESKLAAWLYDQLKARYPSVWFECAW